MSIAPIPPIAAGAVAPTGAAAPAPGFGTVISGALDAVSAAEAGADAIAQDVAGGGDSGIHELMVAMTKASLSVELLAQVRNRALEAYQEVMRMQL